MTDGILLAEIQTDRLLRRYDTLIIDEAHERSLNIDFILGYLKQLLPAPPRPQGRHHLGDHRPRAVRPALRRRPDHRGVRPHLPGRGPLPAGPGRGRRRRGRRRRRPRPRPDPGDLRGRQELQAEGPGDILVFLSGEREIRDTADALDKLKLRVTEVLPLFARLLRRAAPGLPALGQPPDRAGHQRRRDVADRPGHPLRDRPGLARISRYSHRTKVQRLPIEAISRGQRQPAQGPLRADLRRHLHPALLRGGLRRPPGVHRAGDPAHQPGLRHPADDGARPRRHRGLPVRRPAGPAQHQATASTCCTSSARSTRTRRTSRKRLTPLGRKLAQLPVDPRLARMVLEADQQRLPARGDRHRRRAVDPGPARAARPSKRRRPTSRTAASPTDDLRLPGLPQPVALPREQQEELSSNPFRRLCRPST